MLPFSETRLHKLLFKTNVQEGKDKVHVILIRHTLTLCPGVPVLD